jgi:hypothetical protein
MARQKLPHNVTSPASIDAMQKDHSIVVSWSRSEGAAAAALAIYRHRIAALSAL